MLFTIGALLYIVGWVLGKVVFNPYPHDVTLKETAAVGMAVLGVILMLVSAGIVAWNYLP